MQTVKAIILDDLTKYGKMANLMPYELVKNIHLHHELFSLENGLATPTMKIKRIEVRKHFKDVIEKLYSDYKAKNMSKI